MTPYLFLVSAYQSLRVILATYGTTLHLFFFLFILIVLTLKNHPTVPTRYCKLVTHMLTFGGSCSMASTEQAHAAPSKFCYYNTSML